MTKTSLQFRIARHVILMTAALLFCRCRFNTDHLCRLNIDQGLKLAA